MREAGRVHRLAITAPERLVYCNAMGVLREQSCHACEHMTHGRGCIAYVRAPEQTNDPAVREYDDA